MCYTSFSTWGKSFLLTSAYSYADRSTPSLPGLASALYTRPEACRLLAWLGIFRSGFLPTLLAFSLSPGLQLIVSYCLRAQFMNVSSAFIPFCYRKALYPYFNSFTIRCCADYIITDYQVSQHVFLPMFFYGLHLIYLYILDQQL